MILLYELLNECFGMVLSTSLFCFLMNKIIESDPESNLQKYTKVEGLIFLNYLFMSHLVINFTFTNLIDRVFYSLFLSIMLMHSYTDSKTKTVYRPFNYLLWIIGFIYLIVSIVLNRIPIADGGPKETIFYVILFIIVAWFSVKLKAYGKGDGYMLIGISLFIPTLGYGTLFTTLEITLCFYVLSAIIQILTNLKHFTIKKLKFKEKIAFAPAMYAGILCTMILSKITFLNTFFI